MGAHISRACDRLVGATFCGRYLLEELVAVGGFGAVFRATHLPTGCDVAIKVLHDDLAQDAGILERFRREAATVQRLRAANTVATYELGETEDGRLFMAMEWLRGESLVDRLAREGRLPWRQAVAIARAVCASLSEAHGLGIVHRDLKPANIHLEPWSDGGFVKVLDFGIAKVVRSDSQEAEHEEELTQIGEVLGTLEYMAPEQIVGGTIDARTDLYALGVVLYELVTGVRPFESAKDATSLVGAMLSQRPRRPSRMRVSGGLPAAFDEVVMRCLEPRRRDRFDSVDALAAGLDELERAAEILEPARVSAWSIEPATVVAAPLEFEATCELDVDTVVARPRKRSQPEVVFVARDAERMPAAPNVTDVIAVPPMPPVEVAPSPPMARAARGSFVAMPTFDRGSIVGCVPRGVPEPLAPARTLPPATGTTSTTVCRPRWGMMALAAIAATIAAFGGALAMM